MRRSIRPSPGHRAPAPTARSRSSGNPRVLTSPHVVVYWRDQQPVIYQYATNERYRGHRIVIDALEFFQKARTIKEFLARGSPAARPALSRLVKRLVERRILIDDEPETREERAMNAWRSWNPAAGLFHQATRDVPFREEPEPGRGAPGDHRRAPPALKRYGRGHVLLDLPPPGTAGEFPGVLLARRTWRAFARRAIETEQLATLLHLTGGVQRWVRAAEGGRVALKTSPSGGALHPSELYVMALRVRGVPSGFYHYDPDGHRLRQIRAGATRRDALRLLPSQPWYRAAAAVVFFSSVFERSLWRYSYARAYRANLIEVGHLCQTFCLTATWLGLAPFCSMALADSAVDKALGLDGIGESVLYAAGVGVRPEGLEWAPAPLPELPESFVLEQRKALRS